MPFLCTLLDYCPTRDSGTTGKQIAKRNAFLDKKKSVDLPITASEIPSEKEKDSSQRTAIKATNYFAT